MLGSLLLALATAACGSLPPEPPWVDPPSGRTAVDSVRIVVESGPVDPRMEKPPTGPWQGIGAGAGEGARGAVAMSLEVGGSGGGSPPCGILVWGAFSTAAITLGTVGGGILGAFTAMSEAELQRRLGTAERAIAQASMQLQLEAAIPAAVRAARPQWRIVPPASRADAVLTVRLVGLGLQGSPGLDPVVALVIQVEVEWAAAAGTYRATFQYRSPTARFTQWTDREQQILEELQLARVQLVERIVDEVVLVEVK